MFLIVTSFCLSAFNPFSSTAVGALGLFTFLPQCTVHNLRISQLGVPGLYICCFGLTLNFRIETKGFGRRISASDNFQDLTHCAQCFLRCELFVFISDFLDIGIAAECIEECTDMGDRKVKSIKHFKSIQRFKNQFTDLKIK